MHRNSQILYLIFLRIFLAMQDASVSLHKNFKQHAKRFLARQIKIWSSTLLLCQQSQFRSLSLIQYKHLCAFNHKTKNDNGKNQSASSFKN